MCNLTPKLQIVSPVTTLCLLCQVPLISMCILVCRCVLIKYVHVCVCAYLSRNLISTTLHIFTFRTCIIIATIHVCTCCVCHSYHIISCHSCHIFQRKGFSPGKQSLSCPLAAEFCTAAFTALGLALKDELFRAQNMYLLDAERTKISAEIAEI